jgi:CBS domain-containing protein
MEVREGMSSVVLTIGPGHTLRDAAQRMVGRGEDPDSERVAGHMPDTVICASPDWSLERAAAEMSKRKIRHLVIVEDGSVVGVLSMRDIMRVWTSEGATSAMTPPEQEAVG